MSGYHSPKSPSGAHRYLRCGAAPDFTKDIPNRSSRFAAEGSMLHEVAEECLLDGGEPHRYIGRKYDIDGFDDLEVTKDMADSMVADLYAVRDDFIDGEFHVESRVPLDFPLGPGESGTADIVGLTWRKIIKVKDWKFGEGIIVDAEWNEQMMLYGIGAIVKHYPEYIDKPETPVELEILQPRIRGAGSTWCTTVGELWKWAEEEVVPKIEIINAGKGTFNPGPKQCFWCDGKKGAPELGIKRCAAYELYNLNIARKAFGDLDAAALLGVDPTPTVVKEVEPEMRVWLLDNADMFTSWLADLKDIVHKDLEAGRDDQAPGKKLVQGRMGHRKYNKDRIDEIEELARQQLEDEAYDTNLKSPAQLKKALGEDVFDLLFSDLITQDRGQPIIVDIGHPKPALKTLKEAFGKIE